jgi:hypothetical protein
MVRIVVVALLHVKRAGIACLIRLGTFSHSIACWIAGSSTNIDYTQFIRYLWQVIKVFPGIILSDIQVINSALPAFYSLRATMYAIC